MTELTDIGQSILDARIARDGEDWPELCDRVTSAVFSNDDYYNPLASYADKTHDLLLNREFLFNSPTLTNARVEFVDSEGGEGKIRKQVGQLSACFVLPISDTISNGVDGIMDTMTNAALIHQSGGGTGFDFSNLRPKGSIVKSTGGVASGPCSFLKVYSATTEAIKQGGTRRGANMGVLRIDHPDIVEFIKLKSDPDVANNFNLSVAITDEFMTAVDFGAEQETELFDLIVERSWNSGEPGILFIDRINRDVNPEFGLIAATNPCGEQPLLPYDACNLGSIDLSKHIEVLNGHPYLNKTKFIGTIRTAVVALNTVIDVNNYPLPQIEEQVKKTRNIGLGLMGFADALYKMGIVYGSDESLDFIDDIMSIMKDAAQNMSSELNVVGNKPINNTLLTMAPTGTISMLAGCSGGIEPNFALGFERNQADMRMMEINTVIKEMPWYTDEIGKQIIANRGRATGIDGIPEYMQEVLITASEVSPINHIRVQAKFQEYVDSAISKTINFDNDVGQADVRDAILFAWRNNVKGITVYRDGSRANQVLSVKKEDEKAETEMSKMNLLNFDEPDCLEGKTYKVETPNGSIRVTVNKDPRTNEPVEVLCTVGKAGSAATANAEATGRLISVALKHGTPLESIENQLIGISSADSYGFGTNKILSAPDSIGKALRRYRESQGAVLTNEVYEKLDRQSFGICPECKSGSLVFTEGCKKCVSCGYSACG